MSPDKSQKKKASHREREYHRSPDPVARGMEEAGIGFNGQPQFHQKPKLFEGSLKKASEVTASSKQLQRNRLPTPSKEETNCQDPQPHNYAPIQCHGRAAIIPPSKKPAVDEEKCFHFDIPVGPLRITQTEQTKNEDVRRTENFPSWVRKASLRVLSHQDLLVDSGPSTTASTMSTSSPYRVELVWLSPSVLPPERAQ
ncbi:hypothetical protein K2173_012864 (mitochondrion) [Erythroxylum novogranatense]|uniref:Uncharacterized protein n=1 Tax=Erythroxylum novogranatense TaxID=1862640 RepID=A0AAV8S4K5_9ROSI|nr:hypothetical protein K2173_012864 [Erythroxylum novogranatense]